MTDYLELVLLELEGTDRAEGGTAEDLAGTERTGGLGKRPEHMAPEGEPPGMAPPLGADGSSPQSLAWGAGAPGRDGGVRDNAPAALPLARSGGAEALLPQGPAALWGEGGWLHRAGGGGTRVLPGVGRGEVAAPDGTGDLLGRTTAAEHVPFLAGTRLETGGGAAGLYQALRRGTRGAQWAGRGGGARAAAEKPPLAQAAGPGELDLLFQRDARRYGGAFTLY